MTRPSPRSIAELAARLGRLTGDTLVARQHTTMNGWALVHMVDHSPRFGPYGLPDGYMQPAQFCAHLKQAIWAAEEMASCRQALALERRRLQTIPDVQCIELRAECPMVPSSNAPETV